MDKNVRKEILTLIAEAELQRAIELLLKEIPKNKEAEAILYSARFKDLQKQIRLGLIDSENESVTRSQIRYGIIQTLNALDGNKILSVLVAGTGKYQLSNEVYQATVALGKLIGKQGYHLVCGGWEGVDYVIAEEFSKITMKERRPLSENLVQVVTEHREPIFKGGNIITVKHGLREWLEAIKYADIVILIGGEGGTYETFTYAHQEGRAVIPIPSTGGDAKRVYDEIVQRWSYWGDTTFKGVAKEDFEKLNQPIFDTESANRVGEEVIQVMKAIV